MIAGPSHDSEMPSLGVLWNHSALLDVINRDVANVLLGGKQARSIEVTHMTYRPLRQCFAVCHLQLADGEMRDLIISFAKDRRLQEVARKRYGGQRRAGRAVFLPDLNCLFELFPYDWQVPSIATLFDAERFGRLLAAAGLGDAAAGAASVAPRALTYRPHEACVVEYPEVRLPSGAVLMAKTIADPERIRRFHRASEALRRSITDPDVWTPETFRPKREPRILLMEKAEGQTLFGSVDAGSGAVLAAKALAAIHATPIRAGRRSLYDSLAGLAHTRARTKRVSLVAPEIAERARSLLARVEPRIEAYRARPMFLHGDYKSTQLLIDGGRIAIIDLDSFKVGDPAVDVGNFIADLRREVVVARRDDLRGVEQVFIDAYVARTGATGIEERARVFRIIALVRMAMHAFRQQAGAYSDDISFAPEALIREAEECLQAL